VRGNNIFTCFKVLVQDWFKDSQSQIRVRTAVEEILDKDSPETYANDLFRLKSDKIFELVFDALLLL
jgi:type I restriction enzyme R subunit